MNVQLVTNEDLLKLKSDILAEIKKLIVPQTTEPVVYKSKDVRRLLKCSDSTLQHFRNSGKLPAKKVGGTYYYTREEVNKLLSAA